MTASRATSPRSPFRAVSAWIAAAGVSVLVALSVGTVPAAAAGPTTVHVVAVDFRFELSSSAAAKPGRITFDVINRGQVANDFSIAGKATPMLKPGKRATLTVTLKRGRYDYRCTVPGHAQLGMEGIFKVG
jgi:plastocyanin